VRQCVYLCLDRDPECFVLASSAVECESQYDARCRARRLVSRGGFQHGDRLVEATEVAQGRPVLDGKPRMPGLVETELVLCSGFGRETY